MNKSTSAVGMVGLLRNLNGSRGTKGGRLGSLPTKLSRVPYRWFILKALVSRSRGDLYIQTNQTFSTWLSRCDFGLPLAVCRAGQI